MPVRVIGIIISAAIGIAIYFDAKKRGFSGTACFYWMLFAVILPWFTIPAYLIFRNQKRPSTYPNYQSSAAASSLCPKCGKDNPKHLVTCRHCNNKLTVSE